MTLFDVGPADVADTKDDWYTPPWLFTAAGIIFDLDVAAPVDPSRRTCPARAYLTPVENGLAVPWSGIIWCNPPYSNIGPWVTRFAAAGIHGMMLVPAVRSNWIKILTKTSDAIDLVLTCAFGRPDGSMARPGPVALLLATRGDECTAALARVMEADGARIS